MSQIIDVIKTLPKLARVGYIADEIINDAERQLNLNFSKEYKEYLSEFGAVSAKGIELTGIIEVEYCNVVSVTMKEWQLNTFVPHNMYVVENTFVNGVIVWQDSDGVVYTSFPNCPPRRIADSLAEYIIVRCEKS